MKQRTSMTTSWSAVLLVAGLIGAMTLWTGWPLEAKPALAASTVGGDDDDWNRSRGLARKIAGTWLEWFDGGQTMFNIRADGTLDWFGSWFFGNGSEAYYDGPVYCSWKQTGRREITTIEVGFLFNGDGSFYGTGRVIEVFTFDGDFQSFSYVGTEDIFLPDQDPADPDAVPDQSFGFGPFGPVNRLNFMD